MEIWGGLSIEQNKFENYSKHTVRTRKPENAKDLPVVYSDWEPGILIAESKDNRGWHTINIWDDLHALLKSKTDDSLSPS